jgi:hypothetical protein
VPPRSDEGTTFGPITIELGDSSESGPCACCGGRTRIVRGFVSVAGNARAAYFVRWAPGRPEHDATVAITIGRWGGADASERKCFCFGHIVGEGGPGFMLVDAASTAWASHAGFLGRMLTRADGLGSPLKPEVFAVLDAIGEQDDRIDRWWLGQRLQ